MIRIRKVISEYPTMKFDLRVTENSFIAELSYIEQKIVTKNLIDSGAAGGQTGGQTGGVKLSDIQEKIVNLINENPKITRRELSERTNINTSALQKHIEKLKQQGIISREGADFGGYWKVNYQQSSV